MAAALVVAAYFVGTFPTAQLVGRHRGFDATSAGSGNPGASNTFRVGGKAAGVLVLLGDVTKGAVATGVGLAVGGRGLGFAMGAASVVGHVAPVTRGLRGGKGVATAFGMAGVLAPIALPVAAIAFGIGVAIGQAATIGSLAAVVAVGLVFVVERRPAWELASVGAIGVLIVTRHRGNLAQLRHRDRTTGTRRP
ncbi:MAG: acyl phosphate:glycerol-3-phosphate acyltransferase [Acidimicrobiaceae bacterium]